MPRWIGEQEIRERLPMARLIDLMAETLAAFSAGGVEQPVRPVIEVSPNAFFATMPAFIRQPPALGAKLVTVFGSNSERGLPSHMATILLLDPDTGALRAVMDGRYITEARTAAVSAVSARLLAREDASVLALIGSGVQAGSHLEALRLVRDFRDIRCWSPTRANLERFAAAHPGVRACSNAREACEGADVIAVVTSSTEPVIEAAWVRPGAHIAAVGACRPTHRELDPELVAKAFVVVDSREAALRESGDIILGIAEKRYTAEHIGAELGALLTGSGITRINNGQISLFKSLGLACEDLAAADFIFGLT